MSKKNWLLTITLLVLATVYVCYFTDWFKPKIIGISHTSRMTRRSLKHPQPDVTTVPVLFGLNSTYRLTEVKVVPLVAWQNDHNVLPLWHLISDSNSIPIKTFSYGQNIRGMKPAVPGTHADPLEPNVLYHLILAAGKTKGEHDFEARALE